MKKIVLSIILLQLFIAVKAQNYNVIKEPEALKKLYRKEINIPKIGEYVPLKCDFHMHTIFSDGSVWPTIRIREAWREGLDAIAITDHIEKQPSKKFVGGDQNSSYEIAKPEADKLNLLLIKAGEITRSMPPGHLNALFLDDVTKLDVEDPIDAIEEANKQGAFVFWNHPGWQAMQPDTCRWWDIHEELFQREWLHGVEVYNWDEWYPISLEWCREKNLAFLANSDIHIVNSHRFNLDKYHRPLTLVFAEDKSIDALKDALFERRTLAFFLDQLAGEEKLLKQLVNASLIFNKPFRIEDNQASFEINNPTDLTFTFENEDPKYGSPEKVEIFPESTVIVKCNLSNGKAVLPYEVTNLHTGKSSNLNIEILVSK